MLFFFSSFVPVKVVHETAKSAIQIITFVSSPVFGEGVAEVLVPVVEVLPVEAVVFPLVEVFVVLPVVLVVPFVLSVVLLLTL